MNVNYDVAGGNTPPMDYHYPEERKPSSLLPLALTGLLAGGAGFGAYKYLQHRAAVKAAENAPLLLKMARGLGNVGSAAVGLGALGVGAMAMMNENVRNKIMELIKKPVNYIMGSDAVSNAADAATNIAADAAVDAARAADAATEAATNGAEAAKAVGSSIGQNIRYYGSRGAAALGAGATAYGMWKDPLNVIPDTIYNTAIHTATQTIPNIVTGLGGALWNRLPGIGLSAVASKIAGLIMGTKDE
ncbi:MAG: hypothetical protein AAF621_07065 [Pseudomonadota bacterium]